MSYNRDEVSFPTTSSPPSDNLYEYFGFTYPQWCDYKYPEGPLDVRNAELAAATGELGSTRTYPLDLPSIMPPGWPNIPQNTPDYLSPPPHPHFHLDSAICGDTDDPMVPDSTRPVAAQLQAPESGPSQGRLSTVAKLPAKDAPLVGNNFEEEADPVRAALMASLTNEARTAAVPREVQHRRQLDLLRKMPLRRQLSLRKPHEDFYRTRPDYWDATAGYLVGEVVPEPCSYCKAGNGIFAECVVVPRQSDSAKQPLGGVCMSCAYQSSGGKCSFHPNHKQRKEREDDA
ncbi:hypothetical protein EAE96_009206 [Botrytis aclada]|nr:hypothetical protein EAE96_009206 [Botrytis aclada]